MVERYYDKAQEQNGPFRCDGYQHHGRIPRIDGAGLELAGLPPFLRALLVTDGTVTKIIEAYYWEPVAVDTQAQDLAIAERDLPWLDVLAGDQILVRRARLRGAHSGHCYADAFSIIRIERIPTAFRQRIIDREIGIGVLIRDSGLESYREVMEVGAEAPPPLTSADERVFRTYRIIIAGDPVILITETFPLSIYAGRP